MDFLYEVLFDSAVAFGVIASLGLLAYGFGWIKSFDVGERTDTEFEMNKAWCASVMCDKKSHFEDSGYIYPGPGRQVYYGTFLSGWWIWEMWGGLILYFALLVKPSEYSSRNDDDGFGAGQSIFLDEQKRDFVIEDAKTKDLVPMYIEASFKMKVVAPYRFKYVAPHNVVSQTIEAMKKVFRNLIMTLTRSEVLRVDLHEAGALWAMIMAISSNAAAIGKIYKDSGIYIDPDSIIITVTRFRKKDQDVFESRTIQRAQAAADATGFNTYRDRILAAKLGITVKALLEKIATDPKFVNTNAYKEAFKYADNRADIRYAAKHASYSEQRIGSLRGGKFKGAIIVASGNRPGGQPPKKTK